MGLISWLFGPDSERAQASSAPIPERFREGWTGEEAEAVAVPISDELDLHTYRPAEARGLVAEYLEVAQSRGYEVVRVIHGKGTGTLRKSIRSLLGKHPAVLSFEDAPPHRGGWGATMVHLKPSDITPNVPDLESPPSPADGRELKKPEDRR